LNYLVKEPSRLAFGLGIGNASHSQLGEQFTGQYHVQFDRFELSSMSMFLLELGLIGTLLVFVLHWLIWRDSLIVARTDKGLMGAIAASWAGITAIMVLAVPYKTCYVFQSLSFLFWYFSGLVAARRMILLEGQAQVQAVAATVPTPPAQTAAAMKAAAPPPQIAGAIRSR
jgi:hypothetical protein